MSGPEPRPPPLARRDWVVAALAVLAEGGVSAVKVDRLAGRMKVSRGSFYWHFKARADLLAAMLDFWENELTGALIERADGLPDPATRLRSVAAEALQRRSFGLDVDRVEEALRSWATQDAAAGARMREVDRVRVDYLERELVALGQPRGQAARRARLLYLALIGLFGARGYNPDLADDAAYAELVDMIVAG